MIFLIKHRWWLALIVTLIWACANWRLDAWHHLAGGPFAVPWQIVWGVGGACAALAINGVLHEILKRVSGATYLVRFQRYGDEILNGMHWPEYAVGGLMAAVAEEPFFRGVVLRQIDSPLLGIAVAAVIFALCHWVRLRYFRFWLWALWEGVLFGILMVVTGSLLVPMIAHGLHDVVAYRVFQLLLRDKRG